MNFNSSILKAFLYDFQEDWIGLSMNYISSRSHVYWASSLSYIVSMRLPHNLVLVSIGFLTTTYGFYRTSDGFYLESWMSKKADVQGN